MRSTNSSRLAAPRFGGYTNDYLGYLPIDADRPDLGYEVETTPFAEGSADRVVRESLALLADLRA